MSSARIMVVDDDPQIRRVLRTALVAQGYEVVDARNGEEALQRWRTQLLTAGQIVKIGFGGLLIVFGVLILTAIDKRVETVLVNASPQWLTDLTTQF